MSVLTEPASVPSVGQLDAVLVYVEAASLPIQFTRNPQLGLYYVAQAAQDAGYRVRIDTLCSNDFVVERLTRIVRETGCRVLGCYTDQDNLWILRRVLPRLLDQLPGLAVVVGGPQATADPEGVLQLLPGAVCAVIGEGEFAFRELLALPELTPRACVAVTGLAVATPAGVVRTAPRTPLHELDLLAIPRRHELDIDFDPTISPALISGRGCHGSCAFCFEGRRQPGVDRRLRLHSVEHTVEEFDYLVRTYDSKYISIVDDAFVTTPKRVREFCHRLLDRYGGEMKWYCEARVDSLSRHADLLPLMVEAGLLRVQVGAESGDQEVLDAYRKRTTLAQMRTVLDAAAGSGLLSLYANFIIGGAFETRRTFDATLGFALELLKRAPGCAAFGSSIFRPYPGTPMTEAPDEYGITIVDKEGVLSTGDQHASCYTDELSRMEILGLRADFERRLLEEMKQIVRTLPRETVLRHFDAFAKYRVQTEWYDVVATNTAARVYFSALCNGLASAWPEASREDSEEVFPARTVEPVASTGNRFVVRNWRGVAVELDELSGLALECCAGKLSRSEIEAMLEQRYPSVPPLELRDALAARFASLDADGLVVWERVR